MTAVIKTELTGITPPLRLRSTLFYPRRRFLPLIRYKPLRALRPPDRRILNLLSHWSGLCRSEEHTSELQSRFDLVCRLLLEKKKRVAWLGRDEGTRGRRRGA